MIDFSKNADKRIVDEIKAEEQQRNVNERSRRVNYDFKNRDTESVMQKPKEKHKFEAFADDVRSENLVKRGGIRYERQ